MSGTSMDGIDAAPVDCYSIEPHLVATHSKAWPDVIRQQLLQAHQLDDKAIFHVDELDRAIAEQFGQATLELVAENIQATLSALTANTFAHAIRTSDIDIERVLLCGGGVHNSYCLELLQKRIGKTLIKSTEDNGIHPSGLKRWPLPGWSNAISMGNPTTCPRSLAQVRLCGVH